MRKSTLIAALTGVLATGLLVPPPARAQEEPVALLVRIQGDVQLRRGQDDAGPAAVGERLFAGDAVVPGDGGRAILITRSGAQQVVTDETTLAEPSAAASSDIFSRAMNTLAQAARADASAGGRQGMIRPIPGETTLVAPRNGLLVSSPRPTFHWTATPEQRYDLMIRNVDGGRPRIFEVGTDTTFTLPEDEALEPGGTYAWTVFVGGRRGGRPLPQQEFRVMTPAESVELQDYMDEIAVFGLDPMDEGLFLTVVAYRDLGLFYDAREALESVEAEAELSPDLYLLKGEILTELGREAEARKAFDAADERMR